MIDARFIGALRGKAAAAGGSVCRNGYLGLEKRGAF